MAHLALALSYSISRPGVFIDLLRGATELAHLYLACAASNSAFPRMAVIGIDCHFHGQGLVARFSKEFGPTIPWRPFAGLLLAYACTSKSALLLTGGQFVPR